MSEYEIFNNENDENIEVIPKTKKAKKEKVVIKDSSKESSFSGLKVKFKFTFIPVLLSLFAIFCSPFVQLLWGAAGIVFFVLGFISVFAAVILELIIMIKENVFEFNLRHILIGLAFFVLFI